MLDSGRILSSVQRSSGRPFGSVRLTTNFSDRIAHEVLWSANADSEPLLRSRKPAWRSSSIPGSETRTGSAAAVSERKRSRRRRQHKAVETALELVQLPQFACRPVAGVDLQLLSECGRSIGVVETESTVAILELIVPVGLKDGLELRVEPAEVGV